jgi:hypothetical protein
MGGRALLASLQAPQCFTGNLRLMLVEVRIQRQSAIEILHRFVILVKRPGNEACVIVKARFLRPKLQRLSGCVLSFGGAPVLIQGPREGIMSVHIASNFGLGLREF